ncbi:hypothetical protein B0H21DRAFT_249252 [Amylocystis lapponica]|nr:hypothetical protein B0H21DRAFT_249252 [Amylocystis lapponica]
MTCGASALSAVASFTAATPTSARILLFECPRATRANVSRRNGCRAPYSIDKFRCIIIPGELPAHIAISRSALASRFQTVDVDHVSVCEEKPLSHLF